jgi:hypothetical protein
MHPAVSAEKHGIDLFGVSFLSIVQMILVMERIFLLCYVLTLSHCGHCGTFEIMN